MNIEFLSDSGKVCVLFVKFKKFFATYKESFTGEINENVLFLKSARDIDTALDYARLSL